MFRIVRSVAGCTKYRAAPTITFERAPRASWTCVRGAGLIRANISRLIYGRRVSLLVGVQVIARHFLYSLFIEAKAAITGRIVCLCRLSSWPSGVFSLFRVVTLDSSRTCLVDATAAACLGSAEPRLRTQAFVFKKAKREI